MSVAESSVSNTTVRRLRRGITRWLLNAPSPWLIFVILIVILFAFMIVFPGLFTHADPNAVHLYSTLQSPSWGHWCGTDQNGRDVYARIIYGARPSITLGLGATALALIGGIVLGTTAAAGGRVADQLASRTMDLLLSVPSIMLVFLIAAAMGTGGAATVIGLSASAVPGFARVVRAEMIRVRSAPYVEAAYGLGSSYPRVLAVHIVPNAIGPVAGMATMTLGAMVVASSSLSFIGLGPKPPAPEWGAMLSAGRDYVGTAWWVTVFPGAAITVAVLALTGVGRHLHRRFEDGQAVDVDARSLA